MKIGLPLNQAEMSIRSGHPTSYVLNKAHSNLSSDFIGRISGTPLYCSGISTREIVPFSFPKGESYLNRSELLTAPYTTE